MRCSWLRPPLWKSVSGGLGSGVGGGNKKRGWGSNGLSNGRRRRHQFAGRINVPRIEHV